MKEAEMLLSGSNAPVDAPKGWARGKSITMYTTEWCADCVRVKRFLSGRGISFNEVNIDRDDEAAQFVMKANRGYRSVPTLDVEGVTIAEPSLRQLMEMFE